MAFGAAFEKNRGDIFVEGDRLLIFFPITSDFSAWYAQGTIFVLVVYLALCGYGFHTSLGGQKVLAGKLLEA